MKSFSIYECLIFSGTALLLVSFIWAFQLRKNKNAPAYFKFFYWLPLIRVLLSACIILNIFQVLEKSKMAFSQNMATIAEFCIITLFFHRLYKKTAQKKFIRIVFLVSVIGMIFLLSTNYFNRLFFHLNAFFNFSIFLYCLHYYQQLLKNYGVVHLSKDPAFWIVLGLFIFSTVDLPLFAIYEFVTANYGRPIATYVIDIINFIVIVEHLLFIKAYRCAPHFSAEPDAEADDFPPLDII